MLIIVSSSSAVSYTHLPAYLTTGLGFTYDPGKIFTVVLSPASWRGTFVLNDRLSDEGAFGVDPGKHLLSSFGANPVSYTHLDVYKRQVLI